ncbi:hypothetical protein BDW74DRAFT_172858 [Aspergillus multicolor]|uniref:uncharacterized protein n=1 Tax=Aspergillus multicolor TaxID=41759 RepID=UPI003CCD4FDE
MPLEDEQHPQAADAVQELWFPELCVLLVYLALVYAEKVAALAPAPGALLSAARLDPVYRPILLLSPRSLPQTDMSTAFLVLLGDFQSLTDLAAEATRPSMLRGQ